MVHPRQNNPLEYKELVIFDQFDIYEDQLTRINDKCFLGPRFISDGMNL